MRAGLASQGGDDRRYILGKLVGGGPYAWDYGPKCCLWTLDKPYNLRSSGHKPMVNCGSYLLALLQFS